ncbi:MAG: SOS-response repressor and protease LexA [Cyanobacteriota bacterium]|jgi:repressor LexA
MEPLTRAQKELFDWLVSYIDETQHAPSIRQMMRAMNLRSPAPIQSRLERLRNKGYVDWTDGKARTLRILHQKPKGVSILGELKGGELIEANAEDVEKIDFAPLMKKSSAFALKAVGNDLVDDSIIEGDMIILRSVSGDETIEDGALVAASVKGGKIAIKRYYQDGTKVILKASNNKGPGQEMKASEVEIQGILIGVWRSFV